MRRSHKILGDCKGREALSKGRVDLSYSLNGRIEKTAVSGQFRGLLLCPDAVRRATPGSLEYHVVLRSYLWTLTRRFRPGNRLQLRQ